MPTPTPAGTQVPSTLAPAQTNGRKMESTPAKPQTPAPELATPTCPKWLYKGFCNKASITGGAACIENGWQPAHVVAAGS